MKIKSKEIFERLIHDYNETSSHLEWHRGYVEQNHRAYNIYERKMLNNEPLEVKDYEVKYQFPDHQKKIRPASMKLDLIIGKIESAIPNFGLEIEQFLDRCGTRDANEPEYWSSPDAEWLQSVASALKEGSTSFSRNISSWWDGGYVGDANDAKAHEDICKLIKWLHNKKFVNENI